MPSIPSKLLDVFAHAFPRTFKELVPHILLGIATVIWGIKSHPFKETALDILVPLGGLVGIEAIWHIGKAARSVSRDVPMSFVQSPIVSGTGEPVRYFNEAVKGYRTKVWLVAAFMVVVICVPFAISIGLIASRSPAGQTTETKVLPPPPPPEIFADCEQIGLPLSIAPQGSIHLVALNKRYMLSQQWGLFDIPNRTDEKIQWPSKEDMNLEVKKHNKDKHYFNMGFIGYKCDVSNRSQTTNALDVAITMTFWYGDTKNEDGIKYTSILSPLDARSDFIFYIFNDCPVRVWGLLPNETVVTFNGARRRVPLNLPHRGPVEKLMPFVPAKTQWVGQTSCE